MSAPGGYYAPVMFGAPPGAASAYLQNENNLIHQQISDVANKRINTLDYLRKA